MASMGGLKMDLEINTGYETAPMSWSIDYSQDAIETTSADSSGARSFVPGLVAWSGTCSLRVDDSTTMTMPTAAVSATFWLDNTSTTTDYWMGDIVVTGSSATIDVSGEATYTITFQGTGALTIA